MKRARKSNRVSWAPGPNLCQVKLFLSDECPSKVGRKSQDHLQAKISSMWPSSTDEYDDLPPGFEGNNFLNQSKAEHTHISQIKWKCPPLFAFSYDWHVAAGEESREKDHQKLREMRVLEAVYPRLSDVPPSPFVPFEVEKEDYDDSLTALIPVIPIEEEESMDIIPEVAATKHADPPTNSQSRNLPQQYIPATSSPCSEADLAATSAVVAAIMKSNEQGSLIDTNLLLRILNDPTMIGKLVNEHRTAAAAAAAATVSVSPNTLGKATSELKPATTSSVPLSQPTPKVAASGTTTPTTTAGFLPASVTKKATPSVSLSIPKPDKQAISPVSVLTSTFDKPATPSVPLFRPVSGKSAASSVTLPTPPPPSPHPSIPMPHMHRPVNKEFSHMSNGVMPNLNTSTPQQHTVLSSGVKRPRAAPLASVSSSELSTVALPSVSGNLPAVTNQVRSAASTVPCQPGTGSASAVKDANYYKNLIRQHGSDNKQDMKDSQIGIQHNNFQDLKSVNNNVKPILKTEKPCMYFKSSRGCRNGSSCPYKHDATVQFGGGNPNVLVAQNAKRVKLGGPEIKGWI